MNEQDFKNEIESRWGNYERRKSHGRVWAGLFLLLVGGLLLLRTLNVVFFPAWFFTWPMFLIAIGAFTGVRHGFRGGFWIILMLVGGIALMNQIDPSLNLDRFTAPFIIMAIGLLFILRPKRNNWRRWKHRHEGNWQAQNFEATSSTTATVGNVSDSYSADRRDFIDVTAVFGGVKKNVLSKNFKGGDIVSFMGGSEIDLTQADFSGKITIDATNIFGGTKLIVPPTWDVQSDITAIFGGVDDKRQVQGVNMDPNKVLILDGTCMFGGIEIRSF
jgi:predicted membrane protein